MEYTDSENISLDENYLNNSDSIDTIDFPTMTGGGRNLADGLYYSDMKIQPQTQSPMSGGYRNELLDDINNSVVALKKLSLNLKKIQAGGGDEIYIQTSPAAGYQNELLDNINNSVIALKKLSLNLKKIQAGGMTKF